MQSLLYWFAKAIIVFIQAFPLDLVARFGRACGAIAYVIDSRHRNVARENLQNAFPEKSPDEIRAILREHFRRIGENYLSAVKTASMDRERIFEHCEVIGIEKLTTTPGKNRICAVGHFGNFEAYATFGWRLPGYQPATTFRGFKQPGLNRLLEELRNKSGCLYFERRDGLRELLHALSRNDLFLGLLSDQHGGRKGVWGPFFGIECSTNPSAPVLALRYNAPLNTVICYRTALARWRFEVGDEIPLHENSAARPIEAIVLDMNRAFEAAIRRDPANWFWVHKRWKPRSTRDNQR